ncbi:hypothetical protein QF032_006206 [Streptomyces achromogenes]|uniref:hypothetical protein n=1 Tax=Streptomyces achromogenes TaxID=67255 RepID=UPI00278634A9|nr:hypothetical protein [Streptomyces achromogenes]MDQ0834362.1 hypothetical protein [Streptomyces achromogenes]
MSALHQDLSLLRRLYTGESVQQARRAIDGLQGGESPIPEAASPAQQHLEARVLLALLEFRDIYTRFPLGITVVRPEPNGIALAVESRERASEILFHLLPSCASDEEVQGVPGLRITRRDRTAIELQVLGEPARLRLFGLPARLWRSAEASTLDKWIDPDSMQLCWRSSPRSWTQVEREHHAQWEDDNDRYTQVTQRGAWLSSGLLRRAALLHTVANTFLIDGYRGAAFDVARLVLRSSHVHEQGPGPHNFIAALVDPVCGLPLLLKRFRGDTDESYGRDQQFVLGDVGNTAVFDFRATIEPPPSRLAPELWQAILRRVPQTGFTSSLSPGVLAGLCGLGAP